MIIYKCECGSEFIAQDNSESERQDKVTWKKKHGTRRGNYLNEVKLHNQGHGYTREQAKRE